MPFRLRSWHPALALLLVGPTFLVPARLGASPEPSPAAGPAIDNSRFLFTAERQQQADEATLAALLPELEGLEVELRHWGAYYTVDPRLLALLLKLAPPAGLQDKAAAAAAIESLAAELAEGFYGHYRSADPHRRRQAATSAIAAHLGENEGARPRTEAFLRAYAETFPDARALPRAVTAPQALVPPPDFLGLPYPVGSSWTFNGTHTFTGTDPGPLSSMDFWEGQPWGADTSQSFVTAAHDGQVQVYSSCFVGLIGPGGWTTYYYHLGPILIGQGAQVSRGTILANYANNLAQALCDGGHSSLPHVHLSLLQSGAYSSLDGAALSGFRVHAGRYSYDRDCNYYWLERNGERYCSGPLHNDDGAGVRQPRVQVEVVDGNTGEPANDGRFRLKRDLSTAALTVRLSVGGSATAGADYRAIANTATFPAGAAELEIDLEVFDDTLVESPEFVTLTLRSGEGYDLGASDFAAIELIDDDLPAAGDLVATALPSGEVRLSWTDHSAGASAYDVEGRFAALDVPFEAIGDVAAGATSFTVGGLVSDAAYRFRLRARGGPGDGVLSEEVEARTATAAPGACQESAGVRCLAGERFEVSVRWRDFQNVRGDARVVAAGSGQAPSADSGLFYFFDASNWELLVKVLDGCGFNQHHWVFAAATTTVEYTLIVRDRQTGRTALYGNPLGRVAPAIADTGAFPGTCPASPAPAPLAQPAATTPTATEGAMCADGAATLCLAAERFAVEVAWRDFAGQTGSGRVVPFGSDNSGLFTFFSPDNWEILVKVLDGCAINGHYWVFAAGTTTVEYHLDVRDAARPDLAPRRYDNPLGSPATPVTDITAFPCS